MSKSLVGKTIVAMKIADDRQALLFVTTDGDVVCKVDGDCCSHTWIEDVEMPALGFPAKVVSMDDLEMPQKAEPTKTENYEEEMSYYGYKIVTDRGEIVIAYRNSSNGYYGGSIHWPDDGYYYGGVYKQNASKESWQEIAT
jgi:hypothetical protein